MLEAAEPFYAETTADTKFRIVNFEWSPPRYASPEAKKLFEMIFVPANCRVGLTEMQNSTYFEKYYKQGQRRQRVESKLSNRTDRMSGG